MGRRNAIEIEPCQQRVGCQCRCRARSRPPLERLGDQLWRTPSTAARDNAEPGRISHLRANFLHSHFAPARSRWPAGSSLVRCGTPRRTMLTAWHALARDRTFLNGAGDPTYAERPIAGSSRFKWGLTRPGSHVRAHTSRLTGQGSHVRAHRSGLTGQGSQVRAHRSGRTHTSGRTSQGASATPGSPGA
jgi:hypothetical protein